MTSVHTPLKPISNGPMAILPACQPPPVVQTLPSKTSTSAAMTCIRCPRTLPAHSSLKWCELCREKQGDYIKLLKRGRAVQAHGSSVFVPVLANTMASTRQVASPRDMDADMKMTDATGGCSTSVSPSRSSAGPMKRKAETMDSEASAVEEQPGEDATLHMALRKEYQTGQDLLDALSEDMETFCASRPTSTSSRPPYVNFHGSYTIVMDPDVRGKRRVRQIVDELGQSAKLQFGDLAKRESDKSCGGHARTFWCACDPPPRPPKQPTPLPATQDASSSATPMASQAGAPPKRMQSTLMGWLAKSQPKGKLDDEAPLPPPGCGGTITVYTVTDFSHPLGTMGIKGQRIAVHVEHPGRDPKRVLRW
ncbi:hypothetical protein LXA43DRAFT_885541 [Ganoderma leucocontextum]|nr:hypothetical protein LXA43DRAFT_885541 [Ganoderma leucocontextum]